MQLSKPSVAVVAKSELLDIWSAHSHIQLDQETDSVRALLANYPGTVTQTHEALQAKLQQFSVVDKVGFTLAVVEAYGDASGLTRIWNKTPSQSHNQMQALVLVKGYKGIESALQRLEGERAALNEQIRVLQEFRGEAQEQNLIKESASSLSLSRGKRPGPR